MAGWIYDYRQELESNIWLMPPLYHRVWQWIKYSVNHSEVDIPNRDGSTTTIYPGQRATSYRQIAKGVGYYEGKKWKEPNVKTIKSILDWMVKQKMISVKGNTEGTVITVEKWELYQLEKVKGNTKRTTLSTRSKHVMDTNNKGIMNEELMNNKQNKKQIFYFENEDLNNSFKEFIEHRKQKKQAMSDIAIKKAVNKINSWDIPDKDKIDAIELSILNNWKGIFEPKKTNQPKQDGPLGVKYEPVKLKREGSMFD